MGEDCGNRVGEVDERKCQQHALDVMVGAADDHRPDERGTERTDILLMPNIPRPDARPANSAAMLPRSARPSTAIVKKVMRRPNSSRMRSERPLPVTAPIRAAISWTTMGAVTGKGLSDLIREEFGLRMTFFTMAVLGLADLGNIAAEFAGLASGLGMFGMSKYIAVPLGAALVWAMVVRGSHHHVERVLLALSLIYFTYPISAILAHPDWKTALDSTMVPQLSRDPAYIAMIVGLIGTTITPWMQFYLQASVVEKGITRKDLNLCRVDVILGCIVTDVVAFFIVVACAATDLHFQSPRNRRCRRGRQGPRSLGWNFAAMLFGVGLINASLMSAAILPLAPT